MNACDWLAQIKSTYQWAELNLDLRPNCSLKNYKSLILCLSHFVIVSLFSAFLSFPIPFFLLMMFPFLPPPLSVIRFLFLPDIFLYSFSYLIYFTSFSLSFSINLCL